VAVHQVITYRAHSLILIIGDTTPE